jgi:hypothetical protein
MERASAISRPIGRMSSSAMMKRRMLIVNASATAGSEVEK